MHVMLMWTATRWWSIIIVRNSTSKAAASGSLAPESARAGGASATSLWLWLWLWRVAGGGGGASSAASEGASGARAIEQCRISALWHRRPFADTYRLCEFRLHVRTGRRRRSAARRVVVPELRRKEEPLFLDLASAHIVRTADPGASTGEHHGHRLPRRAIVDGRPLHAQRKRSDHRLVGPVGGRQLT